jgi:hypothetical protein
MRASPRSGHAVGSPSDTVSVGQSGRRDYGVKRV